MNKFVVCMIVQNEQDLVGLAIDSVMPLADKVVIIDGMSKDRTACVIEEYNRKYEGKIEWIVSEYPKDDLGGNGMQRNKYLDYVKKNHLGDWCLVLDADEVVDDVLKFKDCMNENYVLSDIRMRHLVDHINFEDSTKDKHYVLRRFFKVTEDLMYEEVEHPVLASEREASKIEDIVIWHLGHAREMVRLRNKYRNHVKKSNLAHHTHNYLENWYRSHLFGTFPKKEFSPAELPQVMKDFFDIPDISEELYFLQRKELEWKHLVDAYSWKDYFKPEKVLMCGDGMGQRTHSLRTIGVDAQGFDISEYAVKNNPFNLDGKLFVCDILNPDEIWKSKNEFDLVIAYDILEHLEPGDLDQALRNVYKWGSKDFLFSIPFVGDPNLEADSTHLIKESKEWWMDKLKEHKFNVVPTPEHFLFKEQVVVATK